MKQLKIIFVLFIMILAFAQSKAQTPNAFIGVYGGFSMPLGNWAQASYPVSISSSASSPAGWAANGGIGGIQGAYFFSKYFGIGASFGYSSYKTKNIDSLSQGYQVSFDVDSIKTTAGNYTMWNFMPGLYFRYPINKFYITANISVGVTHATTPEIDVYVEDGGVPDGTFVQQSSSATTVCFGGGAGIGYHLYKKISIFVTGNYFYSQPDFTIQNTLRKTNTGRLINSYDQPMESLNALIGIAYDFGSR